MSENFRLKIGLEGEKEFKKSLADINNSFKVLGSELKLVDSQFDKNDKSTEALTAHSEVLNKEIDQQKQKIETLRSALANAAESFGENDRRTQSRQIQLNNVQAALNGIERDLSSNRTASEKAAKSFDKAGDEAKDFSDFVKKTDETGKDADGKLSKLIDTAKRNRCGSGSRRSRSRNSLRCHRKKAPPEQCINVPSLPNRLAASQKNCPQNKPTILRPLVILVTSCPA